MSTIIKDLNKINQIITENIDDPIFLLNKNFICEYSNSTIFGENKLFLDFFPPDETKQITKLLKNVLKIGNFIGEAKMRLENNKYKWFEIKGKRIELDNTTKKILVICRDITNYKKKEEHYKKSQEELNKLANSLPEIRYWRFLQSKEGTKLIQKAREMLELVIDNIPQLIYWKDKNFVYLGCNNNYAQINGIYESSKIIGMTDSDLSWLKNNVSHIQEKEAQVIIKNKAEYNVVESLTTPDGNQTWFEINRIPLHDLDGKVVGILVTYEDITDRKIAEQKLKESEKKYRHLFKSSPYGIILVNRKGQIIDANPATEILFGRNMDELINESYLNVKVKPEKLLPIFRQRYEITLRGEIPKPLEIEIIRSKDNKKMWINIDDSLVEVGDKILFQVIVQDITEKKNAEQKIKKSQEELQMLNRELEQKVRERTRNLIESERQYRTTINSLADPLHVVDRELNIILTNDELHKWLKKLNIDSDIYSKQLFEVFPFLDLKIHQEYNQVFDTGIPLITKETTMLENFDAITETRKIPIFSEGKVEQVITIIRDITESFKLEQELRESERKLREQNIELKKMDKIKNDFITMAAHELKTPLISVSGYTDYILIKHKNNLNPEIAEDLRTVQRNVNRLEILMDQLLDVMKIDEDKLKLQAETTNIGKIINDCLNELSYLINEKSLEIILNIDHEMMLNVDPTRIMTVFTNLILNAIKFTPEYGWIEISTKKDENQYIFEIKDNGIGLTEDEIKRLFKKFERIKKPIIGKSTNIKDSGTGLGLYITKGIINAHDGEIWATSDGENKGSTFSFSLPL
ncbi:MAG: PAS domain S-box protein [Promethearchaeota archaeon]